MVSFLILLLLGIFSFISGFSINPSLVTQQTVQYLIYLMGTVYISAAFICLQSWYKGYAINQKIDDYMKNINKAIGKPLKAQDQLTNPETHSKQEEK